MFRRALAIMIVLLPVLAFAQARPAAPSLEGVWRVTSIVTTGANAVTNNNAQPSMYIFTRGHYSVLLLTNTSPRPKLVAAKDPNNLTDGEKLERYAQWAPLTANAGTYQVNGTTLTRRPTVAKNEAVMTTDPVQVSQFKIDGNKLTFVAKSAAGQPVSETTTTLVRVE